MCRQYLSACPVLIHKAEHSSKRLEVPRVSSEPRVCTWPSGSQLCPLSQHNTQPLMLCPFHVGVGLLSPHASSLPFKLA